MIDLENFFIATVVSIALVILAYVGWKVLQIKYGIGIPDNVRVGVILPFSGDSEVYGKEMREALEMALREINEREEWKEKPLLLVYRDGGCSSSTARSATRSLIRERVNIFIGGFCSGETLAIAKEAKKAGAVVITPASSSEEISYLGERVFRMSVSTATAAKKLAEEARARGHETMGVIHENTAYAETLATSFSEQFEQMGGRIVVAEDFATEEKNLKKHAEAFADSGTDAAFIAAQSTTTLRRILETFRDNEVDMQYFTDLFSGIDTLREVGSSVMGTVYAEPYFDDTGNREALAFLRDIERYRVEVSELSPFYLATAYDSLKLIAGAVESRLDDKAEPVRPVHIVHHLVRLNGYNGASSSSLSFDENGDANYSVVIKEI